MRFAWLAPGYHQPEAGKQQCEDREAIGLAGGNADRHAETEQDQDQCTQHGDHRRPGQPEAARGDLGRHRCLPGRRLGPSYEVHATPGPFRERYGPARPFNRAHQAGGRPHLTPRRRAR
jgi:hypothetical protein